MVGKWSWLSVSLGTSTLDCPIGAAWRLHSSRRVWRNLNHVKWNAKAFYCRLNLSGEILRNIDINRVSTMLLQVFINGFD